jgi:hypothetical protein
MFQEERRMPSSGQSLPPIAVIDARAGGPVEHAIAGRLRARALRDDCLAWFPRAAAPLVPVLDRVARMWLERSNAPYLSEVRAIAAALGFPGVWFLNGAYQWCCTTLARDEDTPWLVRTLDWPFAGLGRHAEVARLRGPAGEYFSVTWPGYVGVLTAMAPGRFAAAVNQAPLRRRTLRPWLRPYDLAANAVGTWTRREHVPPDQLLRQVFETSNDFGHARQQLESTPVARPVIFTLVGCRLGERCVIERTETGHITREEATVAANDWLMPRAGWEARVAGDLLLSCSYDEAAGRSRARHETLAAWRGPLSAGGFGWVSPPVLNRFTRLAAEMCPAAGVLRVIGYELPAHGELPEPANGGCAITALTA